MNRSLFILIVISLITVFSSCRTNQRLVNNKEEIVMMPKKMAVFSKGDVSAWVGHNVNYPVQASQNKIGGRAFVRFVIDNKGKVKNPEVIRTSGNEALDMEALRVVSKMPSWKPAEDNGRKVATYYTIPVTFIISNR